MVQRGCVRVHQLVALTESQSYHIMSRHIITHHVTSCHITYPSKAVSNAAWHSADHICPCTASVTVMPVPAPTVD